MLSDHKKQVSWPGLLPGIYARNKEAVTDLGLGSHYDQSITHCGLGSSQCCYTKNSQIQHKWIGMTYMDHNNGFLHYFFL